METFNELRVLDLHGNSKKQERTPDGGKDENVFDIQSGVAIGIFINNIKKKIGSHRILHTDLYGLREQKYHILSSITAALEWQELAPTSPFYLFKSHETEFHTEYEESWSVRDIFPVNCTGIDTARDSLTISLSKESAWKTVQDFISLSPDAARLHFKLGKDTSEWTINLAQDDISKSGPSESKLQPILYRPFDVRFTYYTGKSRGYHSRPRYDVQHHMTAGTNIGLITVRKAPPQSLCNYFGVTRNIISSGVIRSDNQSKDILLPLYLYPTEQEIALGIERTANLSVHFISTLRNKLNVDVVPEQVFHYLYAVFYAPGYRARYAEFLKLDFPRLPLTSDVELFRKLGASGAELVGLHLMETPLTPDTKLYGKGDNKVEALRYEDTAAPEGETGAGGLPGRVYINKTQFFAPVPPDVFGFFIGGYQVCNKWLKDRKGRTLTPEDITHYAYITEALKLTQDLMAQIDADIEAHGGWPLG